MNSATVSEGPYTPSDSAMQNTATFLRFRESVPALADDELIRRVNGDFSAAFWRRYNILAAKLHAETTTDAEQQEFMTYTERAEARSGWSTCSNSPVAAMSRYSA